MRMAERVIMAHRRFVTAHAGTLDAFSGDDR